MNSAPKKMSGQLDNYSGTANGLLAWSCSVYDTIENVSGYGDCLASIRVDALGYTSKSLTDAIGRTLRSIDQLAKVTTYTYDAAGNQLSVRDPNNVGQDCLYDELGRDKQCTDTAGVITKSTYDKAGNKIAAIDAKNVATSYAFDARGRQKSITDRLSGVTSFTYLATGQLASLTDAESQTTSYTYNEAGVKLTEQYPDHTSGATVGQSGYGIVTFTLDAAGRTIRKQDQLGDTCSYNYDLAGRLTSRDYRTAANSPSGTIADSDTFTYDRSGSMLTAISGRYSNTVTYTYDTAGRKATEALTYNSVTYTVDTDYNARGELTQYTYPDSTVVAREYTARGELWKVNQSGTTIDTRTYDDGGRLSTSTLANGVTETRSYAADNTLSLIDFGGTGTAIGDLTYGWDDNKNKTSESISGTMAGYGFTIPSGGYDAEDRLVSYDGATSQLDQSWNLSLVGDWNSVTTNGTSQSRTHGPTHELLTAASQSVTHDVKGNMTLIPAVLRPNSQALALTWDFDNRMKTADVGNDSSIEVQYIWDALGRRVARTEGSATTVYVQAGQQTIADYVSGASASLPTYRYLYASYIDEPILRVKPSTSESLYLHRNQQFSIVALTDSAGNVVERYSYTAYGEPTFLNASGTVLSSSAYANRYTYTGREYDDSLKLYHYRARLYDATVGRFLFRDFLKYYDSWNLYYSRLSLARLDPTGLASIITVIDPDDGLDVDEEDFCCLQEEYEWRVRGYASRWECISACTSAYFNNETGLASLAGGIGSGIGAGGAGCGIGASIGIGLGAMGTGLTGFGVGLGGGCKAACDAKVCTSTEMPFRGVRQNSGWLPGPWDDKCEYYYFCHNKTQQPAPSPPLIEWR